MMIGGYTGVNGQAIFGKRVAQVPAKRTSEATKTVLETFKKEKGEHETFVQWAGRIGLPKLKEIVAPFTSIPSYDDDPLMYEDLGDGMQLWTSFENRFGMTISHYEANYWQLMRSYLASSSG